MANLVTGTSSDHPEWDAFAHRHAGSPFLEHDPLYSLSEELIDSIVKFVPGFFTAAEVEFERDLARTASLGFFLRAPLGSAQTDAEHENGPTLAERQEETAEQIDDLLAEELRRTGVDQEDLGAYFTQHAAQRERTVSRQAAYAGWLLLNAEYRAELRHFRKCWEGAVRDAGRFPRLPMWLMPDPTGGAELPPGFRDACYRFFARWGLDALLTWDWPVPMEPDLNAGLRQNLDLISSAGALLFVPWHLLRGGVLNLPDVIQGCRLASAPDHLSGWVNKQGQRKGGEMGDARYATIRYLYRYHELVLKRRYPGACEGNLLRLDSAFAAVIGREEDTVKKLRLELQRAGETSAPDQPEG